MSINIKQLNSNIQFGNVSGNNYTQFYTDGSIQAFGDASCFDDIYIPASSINLGTKNPPVFKQISNDGTNGSDYAVNFSDNTIYGTLATYTALTSTSETLPFSVEYWIKPTTSTATYKTVFGITTKFETGIYLNYLYYRFRTGTYWTVGNSTVLNLNAWNHVAIVFTSTTTTTYINNRKLTYSINNIAPTGVSGNWYLGNISAGGSQAVSATVDKLIVYNIALTDWQVEERWNNGVGTESEATGTSSNIMCRFEFNEGSGTSINNTPSAGTTHNDGTLSLSTKWVNGNTGNSGSAGIYYPTYQYGVSQASMFSTGIPHSWKLGTNLSPHMHFAPSTAPSNGQTIKFKLEYALASINTAFGNTSIISATYTCNGTETAKKHILLAFSDINLSSHTDPSDVSIEINATLLRDTDTYPYDVYMLNFGYHFQIDMMGSRQLYIK